MNITSKRWYVGAMNDCLFIINKPPRPSNDEVWHERPDVPEVICRVGPAVKDQANADLIVSRVNGWEALESERDSLKRQVEGLRGALELCKVELERTSHAYGLGDSPGIVMACAALAKSAEVGHQK